MEMYIDEDIFRKHDDYVSKSKKINEKFSYIDEDTFRKHDDYINLERKCNGSK